MQKRREDRMKAVIVLTDLKSSVGEIGLHEKPRFFGLWLAVVKGLHRLEI